MDVTPNTANPGHLIVSAYKANGLAGAGTLINLKFTVVSNLGLSTGLLFENFTDSFGIFHPGFQFNEGNPTAATTNGSVTSNGPTPTASPSATVTSTSTS